MASQTAHTITDKEAIRWALGNIVDNMTTQIVENMTIQVQQLETLLTQKGEDYSGVDAAHTWMNFVFAADFSAMSVEQIFFARLGEKIGRLSAQVKTGQAPNFESLDETMIDIAGYLILLVAYRKYIRQENQ